MDTVDTLGYQDIQVIVVILDTVDIQDTADTRVILVTQE